jgi:hypothetical protein
MSLKSLISRIGVGIFADTSDYSKGLKRAESMTDKFGKSMAGKLVTAARHHRHGHGWDLPASASSRNWRNLADRWSVQRNGLSASPAV